MSSVAGDVKSRTKEIVEEFAKYKTEFVKSEPLDLYSLSRKEINEKNIRIYKVKYKSLSHVRVGSDYMGDLFFDRNDLVGFVNVSNERYIQALEVTEKYRGKDIGSQLLQYAVIRFNAKYASINKTNSVMLELVKKNGFKITHEDDTMVYIERR